MVEPGNAGAERRNAGTDRPEGAARRRSVGWARTAVLALDDQEGVSVMADAPERFRDVDGFAADRVAAAWRRRAWHGDVAIASYTPRAARTAFGGEADEGPAANADLDDEALAFKRMRSMVHVIRNGVPVRARPGAGSAGAAPGRPRADHEVVNGHDKGTRATRIGSEKIRRCRIEALVRRGVLDIEHQRAADEIEMIVMAFTRGLGLKATALDGVRVAGGKPRDPMSRLQGHEYRAWRDRYRPWAALMETVPLLRRPERARGVEGPADRLQAFGGMMALVMDVVCDNAGLSECDDRYGLRKGAAGDLLLLALHRYALVSGAVHGPDEIKNLAMRLCGRF